MDRRAPVAVAALAMLLIVSTAGCVEVKDRPERGPFTMMLEMPPMLFDIHSGGELNGSLAQVETELENRTPAYAWDVDGDGLADLNGSRVQYPNGTIGIHVAHYIVTYYGQQREVPLFLAGSGRAAVADAIFLDNASLVSAGVRTPLTILAGYGLGAFDEGPVGTRFDGIKTILTEPIGIYVSLPSNASGPSTYVVACNRYIDDPAQALTDAFRIWPGEQHHIQFTHEGRALLNITTLSGTTIVYSGPAEDVPANRTARPGVLEWAGRVGEEPAPGLGSLAATVAIICSGVILARRRCRLTTRRAA